MMNIDTLKKQLECIVTVVNLSLPKDAIKFHQQSSNKKNMGVVGNIGTLWVQPTKKGFDVSLSGKDLEAKMYKYMRNLCKKDCDGYKQKNSRIHKKDQPFWSTADIELVINAVFHYARLK